MRSSSVSEKAAILPAQCFSIKLSGMSVVDDDEVVVLLREALQSGVRSSRHAAPVAGLVTRAAEAITLTVLFGKN